MLRGVWGACPLAFEENFKNNCSMKKFRHAFFQAFLEILVTDFKPAGNLCVVLMPQVTSRGVLGACPPVFEENFERKVKWINCLYYSFNNKKNPLIFCIHIFSLPED